MILWRCRSFWLLLQWRSMSRGFAGCRRFWRKIGNWRSRWLRLSRRRRALWRNMLLRRRMWNCLLRICFRGREMRSSLLRIRFRGERIMSSLLRIRFRGEGRRSGRGKLLLRRFQGPLLHSMRKLCCRFRWIYPRRTRKCRRLRTPMLRSFA